MPYNHVIRLERNGEEENVEPNLRFEDIDLEDEDLEAIHILTPYSIYELEIHRTGLDLSDPFEEAENRRKEMKVLRGGKYVRSKPKGIYSAKS